MSHWTLDTTAGGMFMIPVKQFWIIFLLGQISMIWSLISWALSFSNPINTMVGNGEDGNLPTFDVRIPKLFC